MSQQNFRLTHRRSYYLDMFHHPDFHFFSTNDRFRIPMMTIISFSLFTCVIWLIQNFIPSISWMFGIGIIGILGGAGYSVMVLFRFLSWKFYVNKYARMFSRHRSSILSVDDRGLRLESEKKIEEYDWNYFNLTKISTDYIILTNREANSIVIPLATMKSGDFDLLRTIVIEKTSG